MDQLLYAFWRYDGYPTKQCLGGPVDKLINKDTVQVTTYGGKRFQHFIIMPFEEGIEIERKLDKLDVDFHIEYNALKEKYAKLHDKILKVPPR